MEVDVAEPGNPGAADVGSALSRVLQTYVLLLAVHDDDVLFYNLDSNGDSLDGYNSFPQYFEQERIPETDIEAQRHTPEAFSPLLPSGVSIGDLLHLLQRGGGGPPTMPASWTRMVYRTISTTDLYLKESA